MDKKSSDISISMKIPLTFEQADTVEKMWNKFSQEGGATFGQVRWSAGKYNLHIRILTPRQFQAVNKIIKSFRFKQGKHNG